jgi:hypothetical protein
MLTGQVHGDHGICLVGHAIEVFSVLIIVTGIAWLTLLRVRRSITEVIGDASRPHAGCSHGWPRRPKN